MAKSEKRSRTRGKKKNGITNQASPTAAQCSDCEPFSDDDSPLHPVNVNASTSCTRNADAATSHPMNAAASSLPPEDETVSESVSYKPPPVSAEASELLRFYCNRPSLFGNNQLKSQARVPHPPTNGRNVGNSSLQNTASDFSNGDPSEESLPQMFSPSTESRTVPTVDVGVQYDISDVQSDISEVQKIYSRDKKQYIAKKLKNNNLLYSAELLYRLSDSEILFVKVHGSDNLLTADGGNFLAKVHVISGQELDFGKGFGIVKEDLYSRYVVIKIFEDLLLDERNKAYEQLKEILTERKNKVTDDPECTEDILQLSYIVSEANSIESKYLTEEIIKNNYTSIVLKRAAEKFLKADVNLKKRNTGLPKFSNIVSVTVEDLYQKLRNVSESGIIKYKEHLTRSSPTKNLRLYRQLHTITSLPMQNLFYISTSDITLFSDLHAIYKQKYPEEEVVIQAYIDDLWNAFYCKLKKVKKYEPVRNVNISINPVYAFLFKSFLELQADIFSITKTNVNELLRHEGNEFKVPETINFPESSSENDALEQQYRLIFKLLQFYNPNVYSPKSKFNYKFKLKKKEKTHWWSNLLGSNQFKSTSKERLVWLYILDCGLSRLSQDSSDENILKLFRTLFTGFAKFITETGHDRFESFRVATHSVVKLAARICHYVSRIGEDGIFVDHNILKKQTSFMVGMFSSDDSLVMDYFPRLIVAYDVFWKSRSSIVQKIVADSCLEFKEEMKNGILLKLLEVVDTALSKNVTAQNMIYFCRLYQEFLEHFKSLKFDWLVSKSSIPELENITFPHCHIVNENVQSFKVSVPGEFMKYLKSKNIAIPKHYLIELIKKLLDVVQLSLSKENWSNDDQVKAAGDLFLAIGHSLAHLNQADDRDFENFLNDCSLPFRNATMNSPTYNEFKYRLDNVENFYLYTRKQNEIKPETVIDLCLKQSDLVSTVGFQSNINKNILEESYEKYTNKFATLINTNMEHILSDMRSELKDVPKIDQWTTVIKQNKIPSLLASLAAVWTILESKDVVGTGKKIKPHCVQILCILRILSVDNPSTSVNKHLSQVLTGQGKSIILGLLSALLAVTGHYVHTVCYSKYLTKRDAQAFSKFFAHLREFGVLDKVEYSMISDVANCFLNLNDTTGTVNLRRMVEKLILDEVPAYTAETSKKVSNTVLLIDEVDVFFSDKFYPITYNPCTTVEMAALLEIQPRLWDIVEEEVYDENLVLSAINEFILELIHDPKFRTFFENTGVFFQNHLKKMIKIAVHVSKAKENNTVWYINDFKLNDDGVVIKIDSDGYYRTDIYNSYYNIFNYFRLKKTNFEHKDYRNFGYLLVSCGHVSYAMLPKEYPLILGVSGVLTDLNLSEIEAVKSYGIDTMTVMPSFFGGCNLRFNSVLNFAIEKTEESWLEKIYNNVNDPVQRGRAVLVFFDTEAKIKIFEERFRNKINRLHILTGNEEPSVMEEYINEAGLAETVTLASRTMGRGVDFKSNDIGVEEMGGTHVIQTFFSLDVKEEVQIKGRTARKDNKGTYELILCKKHLEDFSCCKTEEGNEVTSYKQLCALRKTKAELKGVTVNENIKKSEEKHKLTMDFLRSFYKYTPAQRSQYFSCYPFVLPEDTSD